MNHKTQGTPDAIRYQARIEAARELDELVYPLVQKAFLSVFKSQYDLRRSVGQRLHSALVTLINLIVK